MARILLVSSNTTTEPFPVYPLGLAVIASALQASDHHIEQFDFLASGESEAAFRNHINALNPDFVCMSIRNLDDCDSTSATAYPAVAKRLVKVARDSTSATIIIGGSAVSILPAELLTFTGADYAVVGEGEKVICALIQDLSEGLTPPRIQSHSSLLSTQEMISPLFEPELVRFYMEQSGMINMQTKRGCNHGCIYCSYPTLEGRHYRIRDPRSVVDDMEKARIDHGVERFFFTDSVFNDTEGHYLEVVDEMLRRNTPLSWCCYIRPEGLGRKEISHMKRSGLYATELGTDACCDATLHSMGKGFSFADVLQVHEAFVAERIPCAHFVMFGGPGETLETTREGLRNLEKLTHSVVFAFSGIRVLPGTPLHAIALRDKVLTKETPMLEPIFYQSPGIDGQHMKALITESFQGKRDRIFSTEAYAEKRATLHRFGIRGLLWDSLIRFPRESPEETS